MAEGEGAVMGMPQDHRSVLAATLPEGRTAKDCGRAFVWLQALAATRGAPEEARIALEAWHAAADKLLRTPAGAAEGADGVLDRVADQLRFVLRHYPGPLALGATAIEDSVRLGLQHALALIEAERVLVLAAQDVQQAGK